MPPPPVSRYSHEQRVKFMLALEDDRLSARLKDQIERVLDIRVPPELSKARREKSLADWRARKAGKQTLAAQRAEARRAAIAARQARFYADQAARQAEAQQAEAAD